MEARAEAEEHTGFSISLIAAQGGLILPALSAEPNSLHGPYLIKHNPGFKQRGDWLIPLEDLAKFSPGQYLLETSGLSSGTLILLEEHENQKCSVCCFN